MLDDSVSPYIAGLLEAQPNLHLDEIAERISDAYPERIVSLSTVDRTLDRMGYGRKKLSEEAAQRNEEDRRTYDRYISQFRADQLLVSQVSLL